MQRRLSLPWRGRLPRKPNRPRQRLLSLRACGLRQTALGIALILFAVGPSHAQDVALSRTQDSLGAFNPLELSPLSVHPRTSLTIVEQLRHNHYLQKDLDDDISSQIFDKYLELLDSTRVFFLASDIAELEQYRHSLDDALKRGDLKPAFEIFNRYQARLLERFDYLIGVLEAGIENFDFTEDDWIETDRENAAWPANRKEANDLWRKRLKAAVLNMKLNGKELPEIQELLTKRYRNRLKQTKQTKSEDAFQVYVNAYATSYDPHTQYFSPRTSQNFNINMSLSLEGIGAVLRSEDEYTSIVRLVTAGPADKSGQLQPGDRIVSVAQGESGPLIDVVGWRLDDVVELIRGPKGSIVRLEVMPDDAVDKGTSVVQIKRNTVKLEDQAAQKKLLTLNRGGRDYRVGIVEVPTFYVDFNAVQEGETNYKSTTRDVGLLVEELKEEGIDALVVDLRNNGGGSLQEADSLTGLFIDSGPTVQVKSAKHRTSVFSDKDDSVVWDGPLAVMVNRLSASASEIFAGAIQDYGRGIVIGSQTFGKGTVQTLIPLNRGQLKVTAAKFYRVSGQSTQHQGVLPDIEFPEIFDIHRIGESSLDDAMPWDVIKPVVDATDNAIQPLLTDLRARHSERVAEDPEFTYLKALAAKSQEQSDRSRLSLNEATRRAENDANDQWRLDLENTLRKAKGEPELASLDELDDIEFDEEAPPDDDAMLVEAGEILLDFIGLERQVAMIDRRTDTIIQ